MLILQIAPAGKPVRSMPHIALTAAACCWAAAACQQGPDSGSSGFILAAAAAEAHVLPISYLLPPPPPLLPMLPMLNELQRTALGAAALLAVPQILRNQFAELLGASAAQDLRRGGGPAVLLLATLAAAATAAAGSPAAGAAVGGTSSAAAAAAAAVGGAAASDAGQALVAVFALLIVAGAVTAPEPNANWLDATYPEAKRLHGRLNQLAFALLMLLLGSDFCAGCIMHVGGGLLPVGV